MVNLSLIRELKTVYINSQRYEAESLLRDIEKMMLYCNMNFEYIINNEVNITKQIVKDIYNLEKTISIRERKEKLIKLNENIRNM